jgi:tRNA(fMet)-specific endonuclease VapC
MGSVVVDTDVLGYDEPTAWEWARATSVKGKRVAAGDAWIAAVAVRHGLPLVTHNRRHYEPIPGLVIISEG